MSEPFRTRRFVAVDPQLRPIRSRRAVRVLVTDGTSVLMLTDTDPGVPGSSWWVTPGGGIDPGEQPLEAAVRELAEETGRITAPDELAGPLLRRLVVHGYSDQVLGQLELFYLLRIEAPFDLDVSGFTEEEKITISSWAWLPIADLGRLPQPVWPTDLVHLVDLARRPDEWPVDVGVVEESTVDAGALTDRLLLDWTGFPS
jgi:8-oxo-dGTP pyrophosphatase MutT (NUDIX family)